MKIPVSWLRDYVRISLPADELAHRLTMAGDEVETIIRQGGNWQHIYVGEVVGLEKHPNADRLTLARINYGKGEPKLIVTGASNLYPGAKVPLAELGATLVDGYSDTGGTFVVKPAKLRGIASEAVACSEKELGISEDHEGIMILSENAPVGQLLSDVLGETVFEFNMKTNRTDRFSVIGVARDIATLTSEPLCLPTGSYEADGPDVQSIAKVSIDAPDLCPRYVAAVIEGITIGPSPDWMQQRLIASGLRPINNIVDITNYVMLEYNQPLHSFDYDKLASHEIIVRRAKPGELIRTLDGVDRQLSEQMLVIADAERPVAVAGVIGGEESEVTAQTTRILLESANFNPLSVRRTARTLNIGPGNEASRRFEKGLSPESPPVAAARAVQLILEIAGGTAAQGTIDVYPQPKPPVVIDFPLSEILHLMGIEYPLEQVERVLRDLGFKLEPANGAASLAEAPVWRVTVPWWRTDVSIKADLVEEVARIIGYDLLPATLPEGQPAWPKRNEEVYWSDVVRDTMVAAGYTEVITYSLSSIERLQRIRPQGTEAAGDIGGLLNLEIEPLALVNPLSADIGVLRTGTLTSMLEVLRNNLRHQDRDVDLFDIGRIYIRRSQGLPEERRILSGISGGWRTGYRLGERVEVDFFTLKGVASAVLQRMGIGNWRVERIQHPIFHPGRAATIHVQRVRGPVGIVAEIHPAVVEAFDIPPQRVSVVLLNLDALIPLATDLRPVTTISRYPVVQRDLAIIVDSDKAAGQIAEAIRRGGGDLLKDVQIFDSYTGAGIPAGKRSLAFTLTYGADRTLTDEEVNAAQDRIVQQLHRRFGATLRV